MQRTNKSKNSMCLLLRGYTVLLKVSRRYAIFLVLLNIANGFIDPLNAIVYQKLLDSIVYVLKEGKMQNTCFVLIALLALLSVTAFILNGFVELVKRNYIDKIDLYVTETVLKKTLALPMEIFDNTMVYNHIHTAISQTSSNCMKLLEAISEIVYVIVKGTSFLYIIWKFNWQIAFISFVSMSPLLILSVKINKYWYEIYKNRVEKTRLIQYLKLLMIKNSNIKEIKLFNAGTKIISTIKDNFSQFIKSDFSARKKFLCKRSILHVINCVAEFGVKLWLLVCASTKKCSLGTIVLYFNSLDSLKGAYSQFIQQISMFQNSLQYLESLDILEHEEKDNSRGSVPFNSHFHLIEFKNVSFRYPGCNNYVLQNINLTLERGKTYFIVGFNGSGKTTLIKLLLRLYQPTDGVILIDGEDIQNIDFAQYYAKIGAIFQDFIQYPFDISKNIIVNEDSYNSELLSYVLKEVGMYEYVQNLPSKEHTLLMRDWSGGIDLSQGQWQKLAIARCVYRQGVISILDEPFSSIDAESESNIITRLRENSKNNLTIFITHRFSSISLSDQIVVLKGGKIAEQGTHTELLQHGNIYYRLYSSQKLS